MSEGDLVELLNQIKEQWPQFQITKENLLRPSTDLVSIFYRTFVSECHDKIAYLTRCPAPDDNTVADLTPEEKLFQELSRLLGKIRNLTFTLLDIYQPTQKGTKNFFRVCIHFMTFIDYLTNEIDMLGNDVFKMEDETKKYSIELSELLDEIDENAKTLTRKAEFNKNILEQEYKAVKNSYKEMVDLRAAKEKVYAEKNSQIENRKWELQNEEYELNRLEAINKDLLEQKITESEYRNILHTLNTLKSDSERLENDDVNIEDGLMLENEDIRHSTECNRVLSNYDFNFENVKALINKEAEMNIISNDLERLQINQLAILQQKLEGEQSLIEIKEYFSTLQDDYKKLEEDYISKVDQFSKRLAKIRHEVKEQQQSNIKTISSYNEDIITQEADLEKMRKAFMQQYVSTSKAEKRVVDKFMETLKKFGKPS